MNYLHITVYPDSKVQFIDKQGTRYRVFVKSKAERGLATREAIIAISDYFGVPRTAFRLSGGHQKQAKVLEVADSAWAVVSKRINEDDSKN